jgi:hypothetical protein
LEELGHLEEVAAIHEESLILLCPLMQGVPEASQPQFAQDLSTVGMKLVKEERHETARIPLETAVGLYRLLEQRAPETFQPSLALNLFFLSLTLHRMGHEEEAVVMLEEALDKLWPFFERTPAEFTESIGNMLHQLMTLLESLQRPMSAPLQERCAAFQRLASA